ncbi:AraC-type DNA-binding protein [Robiginitalea myxolifaciens]|uniref:AraC-type DNA-binding protein n=1 Tax=Robiginitalea myxolifaciens TaxID=400055 RepID=A0A1I6GYQ6_9FLAO|nr:AraC family transcriptional regulator [Robiginitalea myxolifaciens]SFR47191.1 AraC-type DNA-binding protein [Robiginitalea myxolifaciens]
MQLPESFYRSRKLVDLVENQTSYELEDSALHIFETHLRANRVQLQFGSFVLASMFHGKKIMHLRQKPGFDFLPGESLILPADELMRIDFPEAREDNPTRCLAMEIGDERLNYTVQLMNEKMTRTDGQEWNLLDYNFHFTNDNSIYQILQRLVYLYTENHPSKDLFVSNMLQELVVRILQANARKTYTDNAAALAGGKRLAYIVQFIRDNLHNPLTIRELSNKACMSESHFYKVFKQEMGISPTDFINQQRIEKATHLLEDPAIDLTEVFLASGFTNRSYFNRLFKRQKGISPTVYRNRFIQG